MRTSLSFGKKLFFVFLVAGASVGCTLINPQQNKITDAEFQSCLDGELTRNVPGILVNVLSPDRHIDWSGSAGYDDRDKKTKLRPDQTFRIASVTKTFVAATILRLWEDKRLNLDDPICKYVSDEHCSILKSGGYDPSQITIRLLLSHASGMAEHTGSVKYEVEFLKTRHVWTRTEQVKDLVTYTKPVGPPGGQFSYSDTGYVLLAEIIEKITGMTLGDAIENQLELKKLGLKDTHMEDYNLNGEPKRIHQYYKNTDTWDFHPSLDYFGGGGLLSTTADLSLFYQSLFLNKVYHNASTLDTMLARVNFPSKPLLDYRKGIWRIEIDSLTAYTHSGFWGTQVVYIPKLKTAISVNYSQRWEKKGLAPVIPKLVELLVKK
jgi:D-alanyl-D-alanine carboxypeptidase